MRMKQEELEKLVEKQLASRPDALLSEILFRLGAITDNIRLEDVRSALHSMLLKDVVMNSNGRWSLAGEGSKRLTA